MQRGTSGEHLDEETILALADGDLEPALREAAVAHLDDCARCRQWVSVVGGEQTQGSSEPTQIVRPGELVEGQRLGEYVVIAKLAQGGMGAVYRGKQPVLGKAVAIKVLLPHVAADPGLVDRLLIEAQAVNAIRHPNVIDVFSFGQTDWGQHYFVMELLEGELLSDRLRARGPMATQEALAVLQQVCAGLAAVHAAGVLHRDLKPSNIFLSPLPDGTTHVKLLDFGLAKRPGRGASMKSLVMGTAGYMAPEQIRAEPATTLTDLYAVGVIAYRMFTGKEPFEAPSELDLMKRHLHEVAPRVKGSRPDVAEAIDALVARLLEREAASRPQSAHEVQRELQRIAGELGRSPTVQLKRAKPPPPRPSVVLPVLGAVVAFAAAAAAVLLWPRATPVVPTVPAPVPVPVETAAVPEPSVEPEPEPEPEAEVEPSVAKPPPPVKHVKRPAVMTEELARTRLKEARERTAKLEAAGMRRIVDAELSRLEGQLGSGAAPAKVVSELQQVMRDYAVP